MTEKSVKIGNNAIRNEILVNLLAALILALLTVIINNLFPTLNPNLTSLIACMLGIIFVWAYYYFRSHTQQVTWIIPLLMNVLFIVVTISVLVTNSNHPEDGHFTPTPLATSLSEVQPDPTASSSMTPALSFTDLPSCTPITPQDVAITPSPSPTLAPASPQPTVTGSAGGAKNPGNEPTLSIQSKYAPDMFMGATGDLKADQIDMETYQFTVAACDAQPYEWDKKFITKKLNTSPPGFAGILYTDGTWGQEANSGFDLRQYHWLKWDVHSSQEKVKLQFLFGGVVWAWDDTLGIKVPVPYPDSIPGVQGSNAVVIQLGTINPDDTWYSFAVDLRGKDLSRIGAGFGWELAYSSNGVPKNPTPGTCPEHPKTFIFEIRNVRFER